jgi:ribosomal protein L25 (general stress protein Ctc)
MRPDWWGQASRAANRAGKLPCVVYKFDHRDVRVVVPLHAVMYEEEDNGFVAVLDLEGFCYLVREMMND